MPDHRTPETIALHEALPSGIDKIPDPKDNKLDFQQFASGLRDVVRSILFIRLAEQKHDNSIFYQESAYRRKALLEPLPTLPVSRLMTNRQATQEITRIKRLIKDRERWELDREKEVKKINNAARKRFKQATDQVAKDAAAAERERVKEQAAKQAELDVKAGAEKAATDAEEKKKADAAAQEAKDAAEEGPSTSHYDPPTPPPIEFDPDEEEEVIVAHTSTSRADVSKSFVWPATGERRRRSTVDKSDPIIRRLGVIINSVTKLTEDFDSFKGTMQYRHDVCIFVNVQASRYRLTYAMPF